MELRARGLGKTILRELAGELQWQRLKPYQKFTQMIERHWDGIAAYCKLENKVASGVLLSLAATTPAHRRIRIALLPPLQEWVEAGERITNS